MLLEKNPGGKVTRSNVGESFQFGIKNPQVVMQTLSSLYNNACKIVVQEYISNARDANREVGKDLTPVEVTLPTYCKPELHISDNGPGLTRERIKDVFVMFGESTKRTDQNQTGGFGIGAKCGLAYHSKSFTVVSYTIECNQNFKRTYTVFLNEEDIPEMTLLNEEIISTNETGVEIIVPIYEYDVSNIAPYIAEVCEFWDVRPIILNGEIEYATREVLVDSANFKLYFTPRDFCGNRKGECFVVLDGIRYPLPPSIFNDCSPEVKTLSNATIALFFKNGELYPAVNRENLKINNQSKQTIIDRLQHVYNTVRHQCVTLVTGTDTLYEAHLKWIAFTEHVNKRIVSDIVWKNGYTIKKEYMDCPANSSVYYYKRDDFVKTNRINSKQERILTFVDNSILLLNNENITRPITSRIRNVFKTTSASIVQVIHCTDTGAWEKWKTQGLDHLGTMNITDFEKVSANRTPNTTKKTVVQCYKFERDAVGVVNCWDKVDLDIENIDGVYVSLDRYTILDGVYSSQLSWIRKTFNIEIFGIPQRFKHKIKKMIPIKDFLKVKLREYQSLVGTQSHLLHGYDLVKTTEFRSTFNKTQQYIFMNKFIVDKLSRNHPFRKLIRLSQLVTRYANKHTEEKKNLDIVQEIRKILNLRDNNSLNHKLQDYFDAVKTLITNPLLDMIAYDKFYYDAPDKAVVDFVLAQLTT